MERKGISNYENKQAYDHLRPLRRRYHPQAVPLRPPDAGGAGRRFSGRSSRRRLQSRLEYQNRHDALTGLENRLQYQRFLAGPIPAGPIGAVFCDINSLKQINDRCGHSRGDAVIMQTADVLRACFPGAHIYRMSGDEFVVLCPGVTQARFETMLAKARDRLASETDYGVSLGGAWHACAREDLDELVRAADESMYADKQEHYGVPEHG